MSFLNAIKGAIFEEDPNAKAQPAIVPPPTAAAPAAPVTAGQATSPAISSENAEMIDVIRKATLGRKTAYTALLEAANKLANVIPDANTRIKAAYAMVGGEQRTAETIIGAIDIHISDVDAEQRRLAAQLETSAMAQVNKLRDQANQLTEANADRQRQIEALQKQISTTANDIAELTTTAASNQQKIDASGAQGARAIQVVRGELESQRALLSTLLSS